MVFQNEVITSRNNPTVKWASSLKDKKGRDAAESFLAEGEKLTYEALEAGVCVTHIFVSARKSDTVLPKLLALDEKGYGKECSVILLEDGAFEKISTEISPQGVISIIKYLDFFSQMDIIYKEEFYYLKEKRAIALCSVRDPGNLGAVIRSSVAFGVEHIILSEDCADIYNPKTVRGAMGSLFRVKFTKGVNLFSAIPKIKKQKRRVFAAELTEGAISLGDLDLSSDDIFVIGNEGHGIPSDISAICDGSVYIPISSKTESLNASVAAGIFMWEQSKK